MKKIALIAAITTLALALGLAAFQAAAAADGAVTKEFEVEYVELKGAMVVLRSIAGTMQLEPVDDRRLRVTDTPERLDLAERLLQMIDLPSVVEGARESYAVPSEDAVIASFGIRAAMAPEAMGALRKVLKIQRAALVSDGGLMILRDSTGQIEAAGELLAVLERMCSQWQCCS